MSIFYSALDSQIWDYLYVPLIATLDKDSYEWDMTSQEYALIEDALAIQETLRQRLLPLREKIEAYLPFTKSGLSLAHLIYADQIEQGVVLNSWDDYLKTLEITSAKVVRRCLAQAFKEMFDRSVKSDLDSLLLAVESSDLPPAEKWYWSQAARRPEETLLAIVDILNQITDIYKPYDAIYAKEREAFVEELDLETFLENIPHLDKSMKDMVLNQEIRLIVLNPWQVRLSFMQLDNYPKLKMLMTISTRMDQVMQQRNGFLLEDFVATLKMIGDETRYNVLLALLKPNSKNKDIAEQLGITNAAVTFHIQKLLTSQVLIYSDGIKGQKYELNHKLIAALITKLEVDLGGKKD